MLRLLLIAAWLSPVRASAEDLASWNDGETKRALLEFVKSATTEGQASFVEPRERVAVFDFDGTLIVEQPTYGQMVFSAQQVEYRTEPPEALPLFRKLRDNPEEEALNALDDHETRRLWGFGLSGTSGLDVEDKAFGWFTRSWHPRYQRPRVETLYEPMLELVRYLQARGFKTYVVTGSVADYVRSIAEPYLGIPRENVIGSSLNRRVVGGEVERDETFGDMVDREAKVLEIDRRIGRRPILAFGNSDGDLAMLGYATSGPRPGFAALVHHDDAAREYRYDCESEVGVLCEGLELAPKRGWRLISVRSDWKRLFPPPAE